MKSVFTDRSYQPQEHDLRKALQSTLVEWSAIKEFTLSLSANVRYEWKYTSNKLGWSLRLRDQKRILVYLLPREGFFKVGILFGPNATNAVIASGVSQQIKKDLLAADVYAEGRGIRLEINDQELLNDIRQLIKIKVNC